MVRLPFFPQCCGMFIGCLTTWNRFSLCVPNFPECFSRNPQENSIFLVACRNTHRGITEHTGKFTLACKLFKTSLGKLWTHREIKSFFVSWINTHREIHEHIGKFTFFYRFCKNVQGNLWTHREICVFFVGSRILIGK